MTRDRSPRPNPSDQPVRVSDPEIGAGLLSSAVGAALLLLTVLTFAQLSLIMRDRTVGAAAASRAAAELGTGRPVATVESDLRQILGANTTVDVVAGTSEVTVRIRRRTQKIFPSSLFDGYLVSELRSTERLERLV